MLLLNKKHKFNEFSLISIDAGHSYLTYYMLLSFFKLNINTNIPIYLMLNKNNEYLYLLYDLQLSHCNITLLENFDNNLIKTYYKECPNIIHTPSLQHTFSLQYIIDYFVDTDYCMICDNDIFFYNTISTFFNDYFKYDIVGTLETVNISELENTWFLKSFINKYYFGITLNNINAKYEKSNHLKIMLNDYIYLDYYCRYFPFLLFLNKKVFRKYKLYDNNAYIIGSFDKINEHQYIYKDTLSDFTNNILKAKFNILNICIFEHIYHNISSSLSSKESFESYTTKFNNQFYN